MAKEQNFAHPPRGHVAILAYDDVNNRWQVVECTADGYLKIRIMDQAQTVLVQQVMPSLLQPGINTYIGTAWQKQPPIWGYSDRLAVAVEHTMTGSATYNMVMLTVPEGWIYTINATMTFNSVRILQHRHRLYDGAAYYEIQLNKTQPAATWMINDNVSYVLKKDDQVVFTFVDAVLDDVLYGRLWGTKMAIDL